MAEPLQRQFQPHPFRLLLILEWILLGLAAFKLFGVPGLGRPLPWHDMGWLSAVTLNPIEATGLILLLLLFGGMGMRLPTSSWAKGGYVAIVLGLLMAIATLQGWVLDSLSPLLLVVVLRSCLLFERAGRWIVAGLMWCVYPLTLAPVLLLLWFVLGLGTVRDWQTPLDSGIVILPNGGVQISANFSPNQVQQFIAFTRSFILHLLLDNLLSFGLVLLFVLLLVNSLVNERQGRRKLAIAHEQLYQYSLKIEDQATLQERNRIAREIHDSLGHLLTAQNIQLQNAVLSFSSDPGAAKFFLEDGRKLGSRAMKELRQAITLLRTDPLQGRSLEAAIVAQLTEFHQRTGICPTHHLQTPASLPQRIQVATYRLIEEALTNIEKHSSATEVSIHLEIHADSQKNSALCLQIDDNGCGFNPEQNATGFGLRGMQERVADLQGQWQLVSQPQAGCRIVVFLPLPTVIP